VISSFLFPPASAPLFFFVQPFTQHCERINIPRFPVFLSFSPLLS
jgi:hypothetical protein